MGLTGDFAAVKGFISKVGGLATGDKGAASQIIDEAMAPLRTLIEAEFTGGASPYGDPWLPKKDGGQPFSGSDAAGRVSMAKVGTSTIRSFPAYPMHFHQDGTHAGGRKAARKIKALIEGHQLALATASSSGVLSKRSLRAIAKFDARPKVAAALAVARSAQRLPARPVVPTDEEGIPSAWEDALRVAATKIMAAAGATPKGGA